MKVISILELVIKADISDHFPVFTILESKENPFKVKKTPIIRREINNENIKTCKYLLENMNWDNYLQTQSPNVSYINFDKIFSGVYNLCRLFFQIKRALE